MTARRKWVRKFSEGSREERDLLGGKGAGIAEMTRLLGPDRVPAGFTITTVASVAYMEAGAPPDGLDAEVAEALAELEADAGKRLGDATDPLLVSVRSGARVSMPGMLDTVLNLGLNGASVEGLAASTGDPRFAWDAYRRFVQMFGDVVCGIPSARFESQLHGARAEHGAERDSDLDADALMALTAAFKLTFLEATGDDFPEDPREQLRRAIGAVFDSWNGDRAVAYRRLNGIPDDWGTAVNIQRMVFGNRGETSGSGVAFSRDERTGEPTPSGDFLANAQGEDVVAGTRDPEDLSALAERLPEAHADLLEILRLLESHYGDMQDVEFTIEDGSLYLLQTRSAKRPAQAAVRFAVDAVEEGLLDRRQALATIDADALDALLHPVFDPDFEVSELTRGVAASPGAARGAIVFTSAEAIRRGGRGDDVILVRQFTEADDVEGFAAARGILTAEGGKASHAALVARGMGRPCVAGASEVRIDETGGLLRVGETELRQGDTIAIEGSSGVVTLDDVPLVEPGISPAFARVLEWSDELRRLGVRANADTVADADKALELGAEGIGLCRTEHMFFGEDRTELVRGMFIAAERWRRLRAAGGTDASDASVAIEDSRAEFEAALGRLGELQKADLVAILGRMAGRPVTVRLLDPPLHEFLPLEHFEAELREIEGSGGEEEIVAARERAAIVRDLGETNPMIGTRGVRLAVLFPQIYEMQTWALIAAAAEVAGGGGVPPHIEIMLPLVAYETELEQLRETVEAVAAKTAAELEAEIPYSIGTMIELPRACLIAGHLATAADFFSFGTNDLTQTVLGFSRDDVEGSFLPEYLRRRILDRSPFETLDVPGVGRLIELAVEAGREANPEISLGVCGEHGGDPKSVRFFERAGLDYVSCSPYRVPIARVAAAQAAANETG